MRIDWRAVLAGVVATLIIGLLGGLAFPFTDATLPVAGAGVSGVIGGAVAGYVAGAPYDDGALNGALATSIGAIVAVLLLFVVGLFESPLASASVLVFGLYWVVAAAIPGAIGGLIGAWVNGRMGEGIAEEAPTP